MIDPHVTENEIAAHLIGLVDSSPKSTKEQASIHAELGILYGKQGQLDASIRSFLKALTLDPAENAHWGAFAYGIRYAEFTQANAEVKEAILSAFSKPGINRQHLAMPALSLLKLSPPYGLETSNALEDPLLLALLKHTIVPDKSFERWMTMLRKKALLKKISTPDEFIEALAQQCELNEYIYLETAEETARIDEEKKPPLNSLHLCYRPSNLHTETEDASTIPSLGATVNPISLSVKAQYEEHPYPRWKDLQVPTQKTIRETLQELFPIQSINESFASHPNVLIAGCGTGQHALTAALKYPNSHIFGLDISVQSLAFAKRKAEKMNVSNIEFFQGDLLNVEAFNRAFDVIECAGVLHHMQNPLEGWKVLTSVLKPEGIMLVSLYSEIARQDVVEARAFISEKNILPTPDGIRNCRQMLFNDHRFDRLTQSVDFYTMSSCRDLLFHVQEHRFTLLEINKMINTLGLKLIGLQLSDPIILKDYQRYFPEDLTATSLPNWHEYEKIHPSTFIGMYHLWLKK